MQKKLIPLVVTIVLILGLGYLFRPQPKASVPVLLGDRVQFITDVFRRYLDTRKDPDIPNHLGEFFTPEAVALLEENSDFCRRMAGTDICGYGSDQDFLLEVQEYEDDLNFLNSGFQASDVEPGVVEVSFAVFPKAAPKDLSRIRYKIVQGTNGWRVDDILHYENGAWPEKLSMRYMIQQENKMLLEIAAKLGGMLGNVMLYLHAYPVQLDSFATLFHFPIKMCKLDDQVCQEIKQDDAQFESLYNLCVSKDLALGKNRSQISKCPLDQLLKEEFKTELGERVGQPGEQVIKNGWTFLYIDGIWSIIQLPAPPM
jgi:hypothetical protein